MKSLLRISSALVLPLLPISSLLAEGLEEIGPLRNLVLLPVESEQISRGLREGYRTVIAESLGEEYNVFTGSNVDEMLKIEFEAQCKIFDNADTASSECVQNVAGELNADLVALPKVVQTEEGYLITLEISDVFSERLVTTYSETCVGCSSLELTDTFRQMFADKSSGSGAAPIFASSNLPGLSVGSAGVVDLTVPIKVQDRDQRAVLILETNPPGAEVWLGNIRAGTTPYQNLDLVSGQDLDIVLRVPDYRDLPVKLTLLPGRNAPDTFELTPAFGSLSITSEPSGADLYIGNELVGQTPYTDSRVPSATYLVNISKPLYFPLNNQTFTIEDGQRTEQNYKLQANFGELNVTSVPETVDVVLEADGSQFFSGQTPINLQLEPGSYQLSASKKTYRDRRFEVNIARDQSTIIGAKELRLEPILGEVIISSNPVRPGARVLIDGRDIGAAPQIVELPIGDYEVSIQTDRVVGSADLQVRDSSSQSLEVTLGLSAEDSADISKRIQWTWNTLGFYSQLEAATALSTNAADSGAGVSESSSTRFGALIGCCRDTSGNFDLADNFGLGLRLFIDNKAYQYQRSDNSSATESASAGASGYGLQLRYKFFGAGINQLSLNESLEFDTVVYNPGVISESFIGAYYGLGANFYDLALGLEFISVSAADDFISASDRLALTIGIELFN